MSDDSRKLWGTSGFREDVYVRADTFDAAGNHRVILPLAEWLRLAGEMDTQTQGRTGVFVGAGEDIAALLPFLEVVPVIALDFPVFGDGRSYSTAVQLRTIHHYRGELRAVGDVLIDQVSNMLRCGFDTLEVTHPLTRARLSDYSGEIFPSFYQPGAGLVRAGTQRVWRHVSVNA